MREFQNSFCHKRTVEEHEDLDRGIIKTKMNDKCKDIYCESDNQTLSSGS
jgi:hypothetical protein